MSLRTPLAHVRGLGSAKSGSHHWWAQRMTAIALIPLSLWFISSLICVSNAGYEKAVAWISSPVNTSLLLIFLAAMYYHSFLGLQVVIEDYVEPEWLKITCLIVVKFIMLFAALLSIVSVLKISLGM